MGLPLNFFNLGFTVATAATAAPAVSTADAAAAAKYPLVWKDLGEFLSPNYIG